MPPIILKCAAPGAFGNICTDTVSGANDLFSKRILSKLRPVDDNIPYVISELLS